MRGLSDKIIVVIGGGTGPSGPGIGASCAARLASEGARVVVADLDGTAAEATAAAIGTQARAVSLDVSDEEAVHAMIVDVQGRHGSVDGLFVNAADLSEATLGRDRDALSIPIEVWNRTLAVNLTGFLLAVRAVVPVMVEHGHGSIVVTISDAAFAGERVRPAYAASKAGITALVRHIASRWGRDGVRCNAISPGPVLKESVVDRLSDDERAKAVRRLRSHRMGKPSDLGSMAAYLLSDDAEWINGQVYSVNGGIMLR
jgi:NAD(P)-dependent dehydrogenase (short-subunit alcohol dehydrogenase family)